LNILDYSMIKKIVIESVLSSKDIDWSLCKILNILDLEILNKMGLTSRQIAGLIGKSKSYVLGKIG
jgi:hypothetical protein